MDIFTLVSGDYAHGAVALLNSLDAIGFSGRIHVGHVGELGWALSPNAAVVLHRLDAGGLWIGNRKPDFLLDRGEGAVAYIDADCIVTSPDFLAALPKLIADGPVLCAEGIVPSRDTRRLRWREAKRKCLDRRIDEVNEPTNIYYNSGFFCLNMNRDRWLLEAWKAIIGDSLQGAGELFETRYFPMPDQDCLNALIQDEPFAFASVGPPHGWYAALPNNPFFHVGIFERALLHCTGRDKPWRHTTIPPRGPNPYETAWYRFAFDETPLVRCNLELKAPVRSWLRNEPWGKVVARARSLGKRVGL
jgi:hypothetical protein